jgi:hypothetical protein
MEMEKKASSLNYFDIFKRAGKIALRHRYLWWFGFFVAVSNAGGINYLFDGRSSQTIEKQKIIDFALENFHWVAAGFLAAFLILAFILVLGVIGRGALISSIDKQVRGESANFRFGLRQGRRNFWKIFFLSFFLGIFMFSTVLVLITPVAFLFLNRNYFIGVFMAILAGLILIPLIILTAYLRIYSYLYAVLGNLNVWASLERAYDIFRKNLKESILMGLLFIPLNIVLAILIIAAIIPIIIIFVIFGFILFFAAGKIGLGIAIALGLMVIISCFLAIKSIYAIFSQSVWILFFHEIAKIKKEAEVMEPEPERVPEAKPMPIIEARKN